MRTTFRAVVVGLCACLVGFGFAACGGGSGDDADRESAGVLGSGLELLPDEPALRRHVLVANLDRLRQAYPGTAAYEEALGGVWFPGALSAARESFARGSFGLELGDVESFATAGFHPAEVTVA
ncbi:MAG: hypothetical protein L0206_18085, partial [Actinobacteria bacterium]|nr:hypothetical protein [Actinomycetota bacterium]